MSQALPPVTALRRHDTWRLVPSRFAEREDSVLAALAESDAELGQLFELENATNERLQAEHGLLPGIGVEELVFGIPNFRFINAAFTYAHPQGSRFNGNQRGAWYCAFEPETALAEVIFHKTVEYQEIGRFQDQLSYQAMLADFSASFHDLRQAPAWADCLDPASYVASQQLAASLLQQGALGLVYPSVRHAGGTNLAVFRPALVGNLRRGAVVQLSWSGAPQPAIAWEDAAP